MGVWGCMGVHVCVHVCVLGCVCAWVCVSHALAHKNRQFKNENCPSHVLRWLQLFPPHCCRIILLLTAQLLPVQNTHMLLPYAETKVKFSGCNYRAISAEFPLAVCYTASALPCNLPHFCGTQGWQHAKIQSLNSKVWCSIAVEQQHQQ